MQATFIKFTEDFAGEAALYRLDPPVKYEKWDNELEDYVQKTTEYVVVSPAVVMFSGTEIYIFSATEEGEVTSWLEPFGSYRGGLDRNLALENMGYSVVSQEEDDGLS